jgi:hypothetical protein
MHYDDLRARSATHCSLIFLRSAPLQAIPALPNEHEEPAVKPIHRLL